MGTEGEVPLRWDSLETSAEQTHPLRCVQLSQTDLECLNRDRRQSRLSCCIEPTRTIII